MKPLSILTFMLTLVGTAVFVCYGLHGEKTSIQYAMAVSVFSSLVAAIIYGLVVLVIFHDSFSDRLRLQDLLQELKNRELQGIETIREKYAFEPKFWIDLLAGTNNRLDLVGHALEKWCEEPYRLPFVKNIVRIAEGKGTVRILVMKPDGTNQARVSKALGHGERGYTDKINQTLTLLCNDVLGKVKEADRGNVEIKCTDELDLPYMMVGTDASIVVSPYLAKKESRDNLLLVLRAETKYATAFSADFNRLFSSGEKIDCMKYPTRAS